MRSGELRIDGSYGEGGGQILRTALCLAAILKVPVEVFGIRSGRKNPGLQAQHLTAVKALAQISGAEVEGAILGSQTLRFSPGPLRASNFLFEVGTAGAISLVLQAILLSLAFADGVSRVTLRGGTHVPWSPPYHYLTDVLLPTLAPMGVKVAFELVRWGFYPRGGGEVRATIHPLKALQAQELTERGSLLRIRGLSAVANLPLSIARRQRERVLFRLKETGLDAEIELVEAKALGQGTALFFVAEFERTRAGFGSLGERGKPAEKVADEAAEAFFAFLKSKAALDPHLADQILLPMALAEGTSRLTTSRLSQHLLTNVWLIRQFLPIRIEVEGEEGGPGKVTVQGAGLSSRRG